MKGQIEYPPVDDMTIDEMWDDLDQLVTMNQVMSLGTAALAGGGGILLSSAVLPKIPVVSQDNRLIAASAIGLGVLGGLALLRVNRDAAVGFAAGTSGYGLATLIADMTGMRLGLELTGLGYWNDEELFGTGGNRALSDAVVQQEQLLGSGGLSNATVEEEDLFGTEVEEDTLLGGGGGVGSYFQ